MRPLPVLLTRHNLLDQGWLERLALTTEGAAPVRRLWTAITRLGSAVVTIVSVLIPTALGGASRSAGIRAGAALVLSHLAVQVVKQFVHRARPSSTSPGTRLIADPDRFSFPSGHATSAPAVTLAFGVARPDHRDAGGPGALLR